MTRYIQILALAIGFQSSVGFAAPFDGLSIGIQGGAVDRSASLRIGNTALRGSKTDVAYGAFASYDVSIDRIVIGAQAEINGGGRDVVAHDGAGTFDTVDPKWGYAMSARAGLLAAPRLLIYCRMGYAAERSREVFGGPSILVLADPPRAKWRGGLQLGGGAEYAATRSIAVRAEYRHNDYSRRYDANQFLIGAAFRF
jgi:outer membrane immunogenic protein